MKGPILLLFTIVAATMSFDINYIHNIISITNLTMEEFLSCINKTHIRFEDIMHVDAIIEDNLEIDFDDVALKVGCLFNCIFEKKEIMTGAHINVNKIKEIMRTIIGEEEHNLKILDPHFQILDTCSNWVKSIINKCEVSLKFMTCGAHKSQRY
ncbi:uncharacterized protein LOC105186867 [Harpegnathos saltator]|uniref:uncharacterized protein LOC105186867 n=1 Tax=Harpegnathos saltator TaxID=610380 RepID=UPI00059092E2|nr:uncharacterized protein LOC105186867 [Harpegnathos saltator]XP_011145653.1 uncharacterized protein LOC105186867 [Harpegnathos saltator]